MKVSLKWLNDYVDIRLGAEQIAEKLTMAGLEVTGIQTLGGTWERIEVGEVVAVNPHPNADRLRLATVELGAGQVTVVCGAPNIAPGQRVPFAGIGARLIDGRTGEAVSLKAAKIRGVVSEGMVCSEKELGISDNHEEILVLPPEAPVGAALSDYLGDVVLDLDVTPNRPDCLSVIGIAREIAALTGESLRLPEIHYEESAESIDSFASVEIAEPELCLRYCASLLTGIKVGSSPGWLQQRLSSCGMRPINNVVDVTNYVMLEYGQPLHAFDFHELRGGQMVVRRARQGETITTLDEVQRTLNTDILVIADKERAVAIAGIMGGSGSEVTAATDTILIESASFDQAAVRGGSNQLRVQTEASVRFDKGLNSDLPLPPLRRATQLLLELAGGKGARGIIDVYPGKSEPQFLSLTAREVERISGLQVSAAETIGTLRALGFECKESDSDSQIFVSVPYWRSDIKCSADLVEEVVRTMGYEKIPITRLSAQLPRQRAKLSPAQRRSDLRDSLRDMLTGFGFQEVLTYSLVSLEKLERLSPRRKLEAAPLSVANPMSREQEALRTSLRAGLLATVAHNRRSGTAGMRLFEIGKVFSSRGKDLPDEREMVCALLTGARSEMSWHGEGEVLDFFDAKGTVENMMNRFGSKAIFEAADDETFSAGRGASIVIEDERVGVVGEVHPSVAQAFELSGSVCLVEIDVEKLVTKITGAKQYRPILRFPGATRDMALVLDDHVSYRSVEDIIRSTLLVTQVILFDVYRGEQVPEGKKSFAVRIVYQSPSHTLTDEEVDRNQQQMLDRLRQELGATLRAST
ncbi:MAG: phenylalanine--tRNA ligase subunit beta [Dehalococcoidia bacterium]|nr:phenylalanine--tRNA ligase subunit beta [Dehalococcoidia bacterium]